MEYFFTCGRGTETFVTKELNNKFPGSKVKELIINMSVMNMSVVQSTRHTVNSTQTST